MKVRPPVRPRPKLEWTLDPAGRWTSGPYLIERVMDDYLLTRNDWTVGCYPNLDIAKDAAVSVLYWPR